MRHAFAAALLLGAVSYGQQIPRPSPDYTITLGPNKQVTVGQYKGKVIALEFLLTTCPHCQKTAGVLAKLEKEFGAKGFQPLGVAIDPGPNIQQFRNVSSAEFPIGTAGRESLYGYLQHSIMKPNLMMPQLVFIDRSGQIRAQYEGTDDFFNEQDKNIRAMVEKLVGEGSAASTPAKKATAAKSTPKKKAS